MYVAIEIIDMQDIIGIIDIYEAYDIVDMQDILEIRKNTLTFVREKKMTTAYELGRQRKRFIRPEPRS